MLLTDKSNIDLKHKLLNQLPNIPIGSKLLRTEAKGGERARNMSCMFLVFFMRLNTSFQFQNHSGTPLMS